MARFFIALTVACSLFGCAKTDDKKSDLTPAKSAGSGSADASKVYDQIPDSPKLKK